MIKFLQLSEQRRMEIIEQVNAKTGLRTNAIEKDWWVTLALKAAFSTPYSSQLLFKGGTSLSKSWGLIERFSEDIDFVLNREVLGFSGELSKSQVGKLRKASSHFISTVFLENFRQTLLKLDVAPELFTLTIPPTDVADRDPQVIELHYKSLQTADGYLADKVLIEIGTRSLLEPADARAVHSIIGQTIPGQSFSGEPFSILTVNPQRTFLEKIFLMHEEFCKPVEKIRHQRMSRHLYDLEHLMDSEYGRAALENVELYQLIVRHREKYTPIRGLDYSNLLPQTINFIPSQEVSELWERDYKGMQSSMIYGKSLDYAALIERMHELRERVRQIRLN
jgi:hypothetical protein